MCQGHEYRAWWVVTHHAPFSSSLLVSTRPIDRRHLGAGCPQVNRELPPMVDFVVQQKPREIEATPVAELLRADHELDRLGEMGIAHALDQAREVAVRLLERRDEIAPLLGRR